MKSTSDRGQGLEKVVTRPGRRSICVRRGGEEAALAAGIPEIVRASHRPPAAPASAGIPEPPEAAATIASAHHEDLGKENRIDWAALASIGTLVFSWGEDLLHRD
jgi:hypothetical protein